MQSQDGKNLGRLEAKQNTAAVLDAGGEAEWESASSLITALMSYESFHNVCRARAGLCMSQDGKNWARLEAEHHTAAVLDAGDEGEWDEAFIGSPQVLACSRSRTQSPILIIRTSQA